MPYGITWRERPNLVFRLTRAGEAVREDLPEDSWKLLRSGIAVRRKFIGERYGSHSSRSRTAKQMRRAAIGLRMHSGWGALVAVSNDLALEVIDRRHIVVADARITGSKQPYHHAEKLGFEQAENYLANCSAASRQLASSAICELIQDLLKREYRVSGSAILMASGGKLPSLTEILASHALIHAAEGEFFRRMVHQACADAGIAVTQLRERELEDRAREVLGDRVDQVKRRIASFGKSLGPPWTQDEKLAALAATLILVL